MRHIRNALFDVPTLRFVHRRRADPARSTPPIVDSDDSSRVCILESKMLPDRRQGGQRSNVAPGVCEIVERKPVADNERLAANARLTAG